MPRTKFVAGNWKMNKDAREAAALATAVRDGISSARGRADVAVCPPFTALEATARVLDGSLVALGAQDVSTHDDGAFTGEVSTRMLLGAGCRYVIVGHSERRQYFSESNELVNQKARKALRAGLVPIVCVGETLAEREAGNTAARVVSQIEHSLAGFSPAEAAGLVVAYEPVWAIGTGKTATPDQAEEVHSLIRGLLGKIFGQNASDSTRILYGGSVNAENAADLFARPNIDGGLIGGASLKPDSFLAICKAAG